MRNCGGSWLAMMGSRRRILEMTSRVETLPFFSTRHQAGALAVDAHDVGLRRETVAHMGNVVDVDDGSIHALDGKIVQALDRRRGAIGGQLVLERSHLHGSGRQNQILGADGVDHVVGGKSSGLQRLHIQIHLHLPLLAAVGIGAFSALDGGKLGADEIQAVVVQLLFGEALTGKTKLQNGHARRGVGDDQGRGCSLGELAQLGLRYRRDLRDGRGQRDLGLEINLHHGNADQRLRLNVVDIVDRGGQRAFGQGDDAVGHIHGRQALILPDDADHRNIDVGENVGRGVQNGERPENQQ